MRQPVYIRSAAAITPQHSFDHDGLLQTPVSIDNNRLVAIDADYRQFISPVAIRRMSRMLKMSISAAMKCLQLAGISHTDAIITGTGRGSVSDMEHFLKDMIRLQEEALNPTFFIQSTYNAPNGWVALQSKSTGYNQTYVHRGISLELALMDAQLLADEQEGYHHMLVGCYDELSEEYYIVKDKLGYWKAEQTNSLDLLQHNDTPGTIAGEGTAFFCLTDEQENTICQLRDIQVCSHPTGAAVSDLVGQILQRHHLTTGDIDVLLCGRSGDNRFEHLYNEALAPFIQQHTTIAGFKHLCGEYETASGFALWLATQMIQQQELPQVTFLSGNRPEHIRNILIVNHYVLGSASVMLLTQ